MDCTSTLRLPPFLLRTLGDSRFRIRVNRGGEGDLSSDGRSVVTCWNTRLSVLDAGTGEPRRSAHLAALWADAACFSCDDARIFVASQKHNLVVDAATLDVTGSVPAENGYGARAAACPVDPRRFAVRSAQVPAKLIALPESGAPRVVPLEVPKRSFTPAKEVLWTPDGRAVVAWMGDDFHRFDGETGEHLEALAVDAARVPAAALVLAGSALLLFDYQGRARLHDLRSGRVEMIEGEVGWEPRAYVAPPGRRALVLSTGGIHVLDVAARAWAASAPTPAATGARGLDYTLRARVARDESAAVIFDSRGALHHVRLDPLEVTAREPVGVANAITFERDGRHLQVFRYQSAIERLALEGGVVERYGRVASWNATLAAGRSRALVHDGAGDTEVDLDARRQSDAGPGSPPLRALAGEVEVIVEDRALRLGKGGPAIEAPELKKRHAVATSPDGARAYVLLRGGAVTVFDLGARAVVARWKLPGACALRAVSADELVVATSLGYVAWVDAGTGEVRAKSGRLPGPLALAASDDGRVAAVSSGVSSLSLVARDRPEQAVRFDGGEHLNALAFDPEGRLLAAAGAESVVRVFDVDAALATRPPPSAPKRKKATVTR